MTIFVDACIERAISRLEIYFPEDAARLRTGGQCVTTAHSKNGWLTRPMGRMLSLVEGAVSRMRNPHAASSYEYQAKCAWFEILEISDLENKELAAWGRRCRPTKEVITATEAWSRSQPGCPEVA